MTISRPPPFKIAQIPGGMALAAGPMNGNITQELDDSAESYQGAIWRDLEV